MNSIGKTIIINGSVISISDIAGLMMKEKYNEFNQNIINLDNIELDNRIDMLSDLVNFEANSATILYEDEEIDKMGMRDKHNELFSIINRVFNIINIKTKNNENVNEYKLNRLPELLLLIQAYLNNMKNLYNEGSMRL